MNKENGKTIFAIIIVILLAAGLALAGVQPNYENYKKRTSILILLPPHKEI